MKKFSNKESLIKYMGIEFSEDINTLFDKIKDQVETVGLDFTEKPEHDFNIRIDATLYTLGLTYKCYEKDEVKLNYWIINEVDLLNDNELKKIS